MHLIIGCLHSKSSYICCPSPLSSGSHRRAFCQELALQLLSASRPGTGHRPRWRWTSPACSDPGSISVCFWYAASDIPVTTLKKEKHAVCLAEMLGRVPPPPPPPPHPPRGDVPVSRFHLSEKWEWPDSLQHHGAWREMPRVGDRFGTGGTLHVGRRHRAPPATATADLLQTVPSRLPTPWLGVKTVRDRFDVKPVITPTSTPPYARQDQASRASTHHGWADACQETSEQSAGNYGSRLHRMRVVCNSAAEERGQRERVPTPPNSNSIAKSRTLKPCAFACNPSHRAEEAAAARFDSASSRWSAGHNRNE